MHTASKKVMIKHVGSVVIYKIIHPYSYLLMTLDGKILRELFEHERLKLANIRTSQGNVQNLAQLKQVINVELEVWKFKSCGKKATLKHDDILNFIILINM